MKLGDWEEAEHDLLEAFNKDAKVCDHFGHVSSRGHAGLSALQTQSSLFSKFLTQYLNGCSPGCDASSCTHVLFVNLG